MTPNARRDHWRERARQRWPAAMGRYVAIGLFYVKGESLFAGIWSGSAGHDVGGYAGDRDALGRLRVGPGFGLVLVGGAETWRTRRAIRATGERPPWADQPATAEATEVIGGELVMGTPAEVEVGLTLPSTVYPIFENALRAAAGRGLAEHTRIIAELWARFSEVAAGNPHAALPRRYSAEEIATPGPGNRMVGFPYTKLMNSNSHVDQAAAILLASAGTAAALGVPSERWVFPVSAASACDIPAISERAV